MRTAFDEQLSELHQRLTDMGSLCEEVISLAAKALMAGDLTLVAGITAADG